VQRTGSKAGQEDGASSDARRRFILRPCARLAREHDALLLKQCKTNKKMLHFVQKSDTNLTISCVNALMASQKIIRIFIGKCESRQINYH